MRKFALDLEVAEVEHLRRDYAVLKLKLPPCPDGGRWMGIWPGQFVEILVDNSPSTFLRRPISVNYVDEEAHRLWLLVHAVGEGTARICALRPGDSLNCMFPLGNGFSVPDVGGKRLLLVGGGVGTAPLLYYGRRLHEADCEPVFLLGGRSASDLLQLDLFARWGEVHTTTEDGTAGEKGFVTAHSVWEASSFDGVATCGPLPMMKAVARMAHERGYACEASLENLMACGLGACLCCVEKNAEGHNVCVCKEGPVFNINQLSWLH